MLNGEDITLHGELLRDIVEATIEPKNKKKGRQLESNRIHAIYSRLNDRPVLMCIVVRILSTIL